MVRTLNAFGRFENDLSENLELVAEELFISKTFSVFNKHYIINSIYAEEAQKMRFRTSRLVALVVAHLSHLSHFTKRRWDVDRE